MELSVGPPRGVAGWQVCPPLRVDHEEHEGWQSGTAHGGEMHLVLECENPFLLERGGQHHRGGGSPPLLKRGGQHHRCGGNPPLLKDGSRRGKDGEGPPLLECGIQCRIDGGSPPLLECGGSKDAGRHGWQGRH